MERESMKFAKDKLLIKLVLVLLLVLSISILAAAVSAVPPMAKPGCQDRCGNLSIPFPFGTNQDCYLDEAFLITCNTTTNKPFLRRSNREVRNISLDGWVRIYSDAAFNCYGEKGLGFDYETWIKLSQFYSLSYEVNKFVAVGCDTTATFTSDTYPAGYSYFTGCKSSCYSIDFISNGSCSGFGCCQVPVPKGVWSLNISLTRFYNDSTVLSYNPCSYGFVVEDGFYNFNSVDLANLETIQFPVALDWTIGNTTCAQAKRNLIAYACLAKNSKCIDSNTRPAGYLCECPDGYHGNPYLSNGCQDIDECSYPNSTIKCVSNSTCSNTIGNYECICPEGYFGDGLLEGLGCFPRKSSNDGVASSVGFLLLLIGLWLLYKLVKRRQAEMLKQKFFKRHGGLLLEQQLSSAENHVEKTKLFTSKELETATDGYNVNRILGQGGQGTVYKGMLTDGRVVAIKKSKAVDEDKLDQFINEVVILSQINHRNVVKLFGCCLETQVPLLVYEFIPNGTLHQFLHTQNEDELFQVTWKMRLQIATEVAGALAYLHSAASMPIYHRDIKTSNLLLDEKYRAKVADFGTSLSISIDDTHVTTRVQGTFGYLDPEYFQSSQFTEKSDVYSFGVVLVELLTGQKPIMLSREERCLAKYFLLSMEENRLFDIVDGLVLKEAKKEEMIEIANLAKSCLNLSGKKRPNMKTVAIKLERIKACEGVSSVNIEQEYEEVDYALGDYNGPWEITWSSSTRSLPETPLIN